MLDFLLALEVEESAFLRRHIAEVPLGFVVLDLEVAYSLRRLSLTGAVRVSLYVPELERMFFNSNIKPLFKNRKYDKKY